MQLLRLAPALMVPALVLLGGCMELRNDYNRLEAYKAYRNGQVEQAREGFRQVIDSEPGDWKSQYYLGRIYLEELDDPSAAQQHLEIAYSVRTAQPEIALAPQPGSAQTAVPFPTRGQIADALAEAMSQQGLDQPLLGFLRENIDNYGAVDDYLRLARVLAERGDPDGAQVAYQQAVEMAGPDDPRPYSELAAFYEEIGARDQALIQLRKAYYIDPEYDRLAERIRSHGMVPGPTVGIPPEGEGNEGAGGGGDAEE